MTTAGRKVYADLRARESRARQFAKPLEAKLGRLRTDVAERMGARGEALVALAESFLPEISEAAIDRTFEEIRGELRQILDRRDDRLEELARAIERGEGEAVRLDAALVEATAVVDVARQREAELQEQLRAKLEADPEFSRLSEHASRTEIELTRNEERVSGIEHEAAAKLPAFEACRLFTYLHRRKFGTPSYKSRGITRRLDRMVAAHVRFDEHKPSYDFLRVTPALVREEVVRRRAEFDELMDLIEKLQAAQARELGLPDAEAELERTQTEQQGLTDAVEAQAAQMDGYRQERASIVAHRGRFYAEAIARFRDFLDKTDTGRLGQAARRTPARDDDDLVATIEHTNRELDALDDDVEAAARELAEVTARADAMESLAKRFRMHHFHDSTSGFDGDHAGLFDAFERDEIDSDSLWRKLKRMQRQLRTRGPFGGLGDAASTLGRAASHPASRVLFEAMGNVVAGALRGAARRSVGRRSRRGGWSGGWMGGGSSIGSRSRSRPSGGSSSGFRVGRRF